MYLVLSIFFIFYLELMRWLYKVYAVRISLDRNLTKYHVLNYIYLYFVRTTFVVVKQYIDYKYKNIKPAISFRSFIIFICIFFLVVATKLKILLLYLFYQALYVPGASDPEQPVIFRAEDLVDHPVYEVDEKIYDDYLFDAYMSRCFTVFTYSPEFIFTTH